MLSELADLGGYADIRRRWGEKLAGKGVNIQQRAELVGYLGLRAETREVEWNNLTAEFNWLVGEVENMMR